MPGFVALLAWIKDLGGDLLAQKLAGVAFGGVGAAGMFVLVRALLDVTDAPDPDEGSRGRGRRLCPCPWAALATSAYALWPAGIAMSSVVGTDMPAAALLVAALALLVHLSQLSVRRRTRSGPWIAAVVFGVTSGLAAWVRAVALPLAALAVFVWLARGERLVRALLLTAVGVAATLLVLLPWGIRHLRQSGELYFTDDHGGITALIGANPNSEGAYTRALNQMFKDVTGRSVLDEPHRTTDRAAYEIAREWWRFAPGYTLGLAVKKADRLFDPEHRLLYWPIFRPGVLVGRPAAFFGRHRDAIVTLADGFGLALLGLALAGIALAGAAAVTALRGRPARPAGAWRLLALVLPPGRAGAAGVPHRRDARPRGRRDPRQGLERPAVRPRLVDVRRHAGRGARAAVRLRLALRPAAARAGRRRLPPRVPALGAAGRALRHRRCQRHRRRQPRRRRAPAAGDPPHPRRRAVRPRAAARRRRLRGGGRRAARPRRGARTSTRCSPTPRWARRTRSVEFLDGFRKAGRRRRADRRLPVAVGRGPAAVGRPDRRGDGIRGRPDEGLAPGGGPGRPGT